MAKGSCTRQIRRTHQTIGYLGRHDEGIKLFYPTGFLHMRSSLGTVSGRARHTGEYLSAGPRTRPPSSPEL